MTHGFIGWCAPAVIVGLLAGVGLELPLLAEGESRPFSISITDDEDVFGEPSLLEDEDGWLLPASVLQPQPLALPSETLVADIAQPDAAAQLSAALLGTNAMRRNLLSLDRRAKALGVGKAVVITADAKFRVTTDAGNLLGRTPAVNGVDTQKRSPVVTDPRVRGNRVGRLAASGSYWVPARLDLDTMLSKIDSRIISDMIVIKGPFSVEHGPGFEFVDIELLRSPRYADGFESHGSTSADYKTNGEQVYGRQQVWGGGTDWGFRVGYGHRTGNDYAAGNGTSIPSSYNSRDWDVALGYDLSEDCQIEFSYLRLDQTGVELASLSYDIDYLVTDGFETTLTVVDHPHYDRLEVEAWYNRTRLEGNAQEPGKRRLFPIYDLTHLFYTTDVDSLSTGTRASLTWNTTDASSLTLGADLRFVKQEVNELTTGRIGAIIFDSNSPVPNSYVGNPGIYAEYSNPLTDRTTLNAGIRADSARANVTDDPAKLASLGPEGLSLAEILGTDEFAQTFSLWSAYLTAEHEINCCWSTSAGFGYAERPPMQTELYAAEPFMFLLQNGLNTVVGDPTLAPERMWQLNVGIDYDGGWLRCGASGFHSWVRDYITFENTRVFTLGTQQQVNLQFVNTDLATLAGAELYAEADLNDWLTPFAQMHYVEGRDQTRDGTFATERATGGMAKSKVFGLPRGFYGKTGGSEEPLPGISPLECRAGIRLHESAAEPSWFVELGARIVDQQDRVAQSLLESTTPGFTVWDIRAAWQPSDRFNIVCGIENFTDRAYREHLDYRSPDGFQVFQPGINFYAGSEVLY
ncbi:MAG: TonB-dependent receptor [Planctomycetaceae bacterium]|nr:TonB-dependent receptor [Planctomycetales bacterium]MCB9926516.1 TonB-dependent receptor [Planctomycetaceae bacterium]